MYSKKIIWLAVLFLAACQSAPQAVQPAATPETWQVYISPALSWMGPHMNHCMQNHPQANLLVLNLPPVDYTPLAGDLRFRWGPENGMNGYPVVLGEEELLVIVHPDNPIGELSLDTLQDIYTGKITSWQEINGNEDFTGEIQAWAYLDGEDIQSVFETAISNPRLSSQLFIAPDNKTLVQSIAANPLAIGFITDYWSMTAVRTLSITDMDDSTRLHPILAISDSEPQGARLEWLLCLQNAIQPDLHY